MTAPASRHLASCINPATDHGRPTAAAPSADDRHPWRLSEAQALDIDLAMLADKRRGGYAQREMARAMQLQLQQQACCDKEPRRD